MDSLSIGLNGRNTAEILDGKVFLTDLITHFNQVITGMKGWLEPFGMSPLQTKFFRYLLWGSGIRCWGHEPAEECWVKFFLSI